MSIFLSLTDTPKAPVITGMLAATEGQLVTLNCSVSYFCPSRPPALQWVWERGARLNATEPAVVHKLHPEPQRLMLLSPLSFTVSHQVKPRLRCEAVYPGAEALATSKDLHVTCKKSLQPVSFVLLCSICTKSTFQMLRSFAERCNGSGPDPGGAGGGQCLVGLLVQSRPAGVRVPLVLQSAGPHGAPAPAHALGPAVQRDPGHEGPLLGKEPDWPGRVAAYAVERTM